MKHTPEPWVLFEVGERFKYQCPAAASDNTSILTTTEEDGVVWAAVYNDEDARRIVACVNACAGMENPADEIAKLKSERSEMLSALKEILNINWRDDLEGLDRPTDFAERQAALRALGKATDMARKVMLTIKGDLND